jgi:hypothetical protein
VNRQPVADFIVLDASLTKGIVSWAERFINGDRRHIATQTGGIKTLDQLLLIFGGLQLICSRWRIRRQLIASPYHV